MKTILVATDFSPASVNAANYAADMALSIGAGLMLLNVYSVPVSYGELPVVMDMEGLQANADRELNKIKELLNNRTGRRLHIRTAARMGDFFQELKTLCEQVNPYAVILGSQGTTAAQRFLFGSHATYAMKHLAWPLITVPPGASFREIKKIGLACDFNAVLDSIPVEEIKRLMSDFNAELHILHTGKRETFDPDMVFESGMLQELLGKMKPKYHFINNEHIDDGIIEFAEQNQIGLLVTLPKRHNLVERLLHKSHSSQLVLHSHVPVMALHPTS